MTEIAIALIRHGNYHQRANTPSAHQPWPLNDEGRAQAQGCAIQLKELALQLDLAIHSHWFSSPLARAQETANIINETLGINAKVTLCDRLMERGLGAANNLTIAEIEHCLQDLQLLESTPADWKSNSYFRLPLPGAESLMEAGERVAAQLREIALCPDSHKTLVPVIGHGAAFRHAAHQLGVLAFDDIKRYSMHFAQPVILFHNSHGEWTHCAGEWKVRPRNTEFTD